MTKSTKMIKLLINFWKEKNQSKLTVSWAESLMAYVNELTSNEKFIEQMYDHVAGLFYTMDTAPAQAIVAFPHLANMGSMTSKLRRTYNWNEQAVEMVQNRQGVQTKQVKLKVLDAFLEHQNADDVTRYFCRMLGTPIPKNKNEKEAKEQPTSSKTSKTPCTVHFIPEYDISEEDTVCLAQAADLLDMEEDAERMIDLGSQLSDQPGSVYSQRADIEDVMSMMSYQTSKSSRIMAAFQDQNKIDLNLSQLDIDFEAKLTLPLQHDDKGEIQIQALTSDMHVAICTHWDVNTYSKCENEAIKGQYWCEEHQGLHFDRSDDFLKELKGFDDDLKFHLSKSIEVENHDDALIMLVHEYATSFTGPTDAFIHGRNQTEKILTVSYDAYMANKSCEFSKFNHEPFRALFKEANFSGKKYFHNKKFLNQFLF